MKSYQWIKPIGIIVIVFGALAIVERLATISILGMMENANFPGQELSPGLIWWKTRITYAGILIYSLYLVAGIFFLLKKSFSLNLIYAVLILSLLYQALPMIFLGQYNSDARYDFSFQIERLIGLAIDMVLIIGVFWVSGNYFKTREEIRQELGANYKVKKWDPRRLKLLSRLGVICLLFPLYLLIAWGFAAQMGADQYERLEYFYRYMPPFLRSQFSGTYWSVAFCVAGITLSSIGLKLPGMLWKILNTLVLTLSILMLMLFLFSLM